MATAVAVLLGLAVLAAACGSSGTDTTTGPGASASTGGENASAWTVADLEAIQADPNLKAMLPTSITDRDELLVGSAIPYPPWEYYDPPSSQNVTGFDYDLAQALGKKVGISTTTFVQTPAESIVLSVLSGEVDMVMADAYDNLERQQQGLTFVDYALDGTSILVEKGNPGGISGLDSLAGKTVACVVGTTQQELLQKFDEQFRSEGKEPMKILALPDQPAALLAVTSGRAIGDLTDHSVAAYIAQTTDGGNTFEVVTDPDFPNGYEPAIVGIEIKAENKGLVDAMQQALQALIDEGAYQKIVDKYGVLPVESAEINQGQ